MIFWRKLVEDDKQKENDQNKYTSDLKGRI